MKLRFYTKIEKLNTAPLDPALKCLSELNVRKYPTELQFFDEETQTWKPVEEVIEYV